MHSYPLTFDQLIMQIKSLHSAGNTRSAEQIAYHLSLSLQEDLTYIHHMHGTPIAEVSAKYILIKTMQQLGLIK